MSLTRGAYPLRVTTAVEAAARDHAAIASGVSSFSLMVTAGTRSAEVIMRSYGHALAGGVAVFAGTGNNGGDAYIVAAQLARAGVRVRVLGAGEPRTPDAQRAVSLAREAGGARLTFEPATGREAVLVDGLLGTGHRAGLREPIAGFVARMQAHRARGAHVVALDVPTGLNATTGACDEGSVPAALTVTYGTIKRGLLLSRAHAGRIVLVDIELGAHVALSDDAWLLADHHSLAQCLPTVPWNAHKGQRGFLEVVGGGEGMAGAVTLAVRAALASGLGLARAYVAGASVAPLQHVVPQAITRSWRLSDDSATSAAPTPADAADAGSAKAPTALALGPGLGRTAAAIAVMRETLDAWPTVPVVLDADALNLIAAESGDVAFTLRAWCGEEREVVCTPHPLEFARLTGVAASASWADREAALRNFATRSRATILLKGAPTLIATTTIATPSVHGVAAPPARVIAVPPARVIAVPHGTTLLATGGSGDMLTGLIGGLLAQGVAAPDAAAVGASVHGIAAELVTEQAGGVRGLVLDDVLRALPQAWRQIERALLPPPGVLADLRAPDAVNGAL